MSEFLILVLIGVFAGFFSGLFGVGGGVIIVPALVFFLSLTQKEAQGISLGLLALPVAAVGAYTYYKQGNFNMQFSLIMALGFLVGGLIGGKVANVIDTEVLKKGFAVLIILIGLKTLFSKSTVKSDLPNTVVPSDHQKKEE